MKVRATLAFGIMIAAEAVSAQSVLFDFNNGPQYTSVPLDEFTGGLRAHFSATGSGYSIQNTAQVIGMLPTGFSGLGMTPNSVFGADLMVSFWDASSGHSRFLSDASILVAPQELACDSSSTMQILACNGTTLVGSNTAISLDQNFTWPVINLTFASSHPFDNLVIHFLSGPPTGGDWGGIFVADNLKVTALATPEPAAVFPLGFGIVGLLLRRPTAARNRTRSQRDL